MKVIVGLGNPGIEYQRNRHNVGFIILDSFAKIHDISWSEEKKLLAQVAKSSELLLVKPTTFMNSSGDCVSKIMSYFKLGTEDLIVVHDDVDLDFGKVVSKKGSGSAGHHGIEDIIQKIGTQEFLRYRVGIGRPENSSFDVSDWVLSDLSDSEYEKIKNIPLLIS